MDRWMSYGELDRLSGQLGAWLQGLGLAPGARVAIMLPNVPQFAVTMAAVLRAGYTCVNVNPLYTARELSTSSRTRAPAPSSSWRTLPTRWPRWCTAPCSMW
jgi:acyl-CoA synthetase (AMP-forming)/AMP-acid ligase II